MVERPSSGVCRVHTPGRDDLRGADGTIDRGVISALADMAGISALVPLLASDCRATTCGLRVSLLAPARGPSLEAVGRVVSAGRSIAVSEAEVRDADGTSVAVALVTFAITRGRAEGTVGARPPYVEVGTP